MQTTVNVTYPDKETLSREEQLTLSLDMKVKEIEQLQKQCDSHRSEVMDIERRYEKTIDSITLERNQAKNKVSELEIELRILKGKLHHANEVIGMFVDKL